MGNQSTDERSLQQEVMSFMSAAVNTRKWDYHAAHELVRKMLNANWHLNTNSLKCVSAGCENNCERGNPYLCSEHARPTS